MLFRCAIKVSTSLGEVHLRIVHWASAQSIYLTPQSDFFGASYSLSSTAIGQVKMPSHVAPSHPKTNLHTMRTRHLFTIGLLGTITLCSSCFSGVGSEELGSIISNLVKDENVAAPELLGAQETSAETERAPVIPGDATGHWKHTLTREMRGYTATSTANLRINRTGERWLYSMEKITSDDLNQTDALVQEFEGEILIQHGRLELSDQLHVDKGAHVEFDSDELTLFFTRSNEDPFTFYRTRGKVTLDKKVQSGTSSILSNKKNVNVRSAAPSGKVVQTVDGGQQFNVVEVKYLPDPIYLLRERAHLRRVDGNKPLLKEANHKLDQLEDRGEFCIAQVLDNEENPTAVIVPKRLVETRQSAWYKSEDIGGWVFSGLCTELIPSTP